METLRQIREAAGIKPKDALSQLQIAEPRFPKSLMGLHHIEMRGTSHLHYINAMATVYGVSRERIEQAAFAPKDFNQKG